MPMDTRIVEFIAALRAAGLRISVAESTDALRAIEHVGIAEKELFRAALQTAVVKEATDREVFQRLFPLYFGGEAPPMQQPGSSMDEHDQQMFEQMLKHLLETMSPEELARLFEAMMSGQPLNQHTLSEMLDQAMPTPMPPMPMPPSSARAQAFMARQAMRAMQFEQLDQALADLLEQLREAGMSEAALRELAQTARENQQALAEQMGQQVGRRLLETASQQQQGAPPRPGPDLSALMDRPFEQLNRKEVEEMRHVVTRLAARLRSRAALRRRRGKAGTLDTKNTIRTNLRFGGVPMVLRHRRRHRKPRITVICDLSYSMRPVSSFTLLLIYALQDQISRTRSFAFIDDLADISTDFAELRPEQAIEQVQRRIRPPGSYATDLGSSLHTFVRDHFSSVDHRTTVLFLGDGRNNYRDPNLGAFEQICRRAHKVIWFNPEAPHMWGVEYSDTLNSDMLDYAGHCDAVHHVSNLRQLVAAIDRLFTR